MIRNQLGGVPGQHQLSQGGNSVFRSLYIRPLDDPDPAGGVRGEWSFVNILAGDERGLRILLFHKPQKHIYSHPNACVTQTDSQWNPCWSTQQDQLLQSLTPFESCLALAETHIWEHFSSALSVSQQALGQKGHNKRWWRQDWVKLVCLNKPAESIKINWSHI